MKIAKTERERTSDNDEAASVIAELPGGAAVVVPGGGEFVITVAEVVAGLAVEVVETVDKPEVVVVVADLVVELVTGPPVPVLPDVAVELIVVVLTLVDGVVVVFAVELTRTGRKKNSGSSLISFEITASKLATVDG